MEKYSLIFAESEEYVMADVVIVGIIGTALAGVFWKKRKDHGSGNGGCGCSGCGGCGNCPSKGACHQ